MQAAIDYVLTPRERRTLELLALGLSTAEIGRHLFISSQTVTYHIGNLLRKMQATNRTGLVSRAFVTNVLDSELWPPTSSLG
jgi:DNA-binding CsgD family transcriptional regulator